MGYNESLNPNSNYPIMTQSEWDSAPWNDPYTTPKSFNVTVSQSLSKNTNVMTRDYIEVRDEDDMFTVDTSDTDWGSAYTTTHMTPLELLQSYADYLTNEINRMAGVKDIKRLEYLRDECLNWVEDEFVVEED